MGGLKHSERIFLGLALLHRYSNEHRGVQFQELCSLIDEKARLDALIVGKAMRFGSMLWMENDADRGELRWFPKKKLMELHLSQDAMPLFGEVAEARLNSLASSLGAEVKVRTRAQ